MSCRRRPAHARRRGHLARRDDGVARGDHVAVDQRLEGRELPRTGVGEQQLLVTRHQQVADDLVVEDARVVVGGVRRRLAEAVDLEAAPVERSAGREQVDPLPTDRDRAAGRLQVQRGQQVVGLAAARPLRRHRVDVGTRIGNTGWAGLAGR